MRPSKMGFLSSGLMVIEMSRWQFSDGGWYGAVMNSSEAKSGSRQDSRTWLQ